MVLFCFVFIVLQGINGILADEMGLGKTVQSIALLAHLAEVRGLAVYKLCLFINSGWCLLEATINQLLMAMFFIL